MQPPKVGDVGNDLSFEAAAQLACNYQVAASYRACIRSRSSAQGQAPLRKETEAATDLAAVAALVGGEDGVKRAERPAGSGEGEIL